MSWTNQPVAEPVDCPCAAQVIQLSALLPSPAPGPFDFNLLTTLTSPLEDLLKCIEQCKQRHTATRNIQSESDDSLIPLAESILGICHAACVTYDLLDRQANISTSTGPAGASTQNTENSASLPPAPNTDLSFQSNISTWSCIKTPMALGSLTLQGEEESLLARQIVYTVLTSLSALLRVVYIQDKASQDDFVGPDGIGDSGGGRGTLYGREGMGDVSRCLSGVLALLGKVVPG
ncbi:uncharacterized protein APUU_22016S [Aspergillus puulaauensis]|uniref:Aflatoxin regulatory protein domain-containing protein n=1 Tax=Aspergillus puulaauensis TaxID=1220207 RepID=A0A7R7XJ55_9EURO|nr:uncharacterized protein APUU_22016S [Aspergillus puulaauensis]BCS21584.1 hypothetical protein APUU_22016S [Aspergillus puulaauensis]